MTMARPRAGQKDRIMSKTNDGGSAFPHWDASAIHSIGKSAMDATASHDEQDAQYIAATAQAAKGLTKLEYFMAHVQVPSDLSIKRCEHLAGRAFNNKGSVEESVKFWAEAEAGYRYEYAKAMLDRIERGES